jgi:hypothetical protein
MNKIANITVYDRIAIIDNINKQGSANIYEPKIVSIDELRQLFSIKEESSMIMPLWIVWYEVKDVNMKVLVCRNTQYLDFTYSNIQYHLHYPYLYFLFDLRVENNMYKVINTSIFSSFNPPRENTRIYQVRLNNVYGDARLCWGDVLTRELRSIHGLHELNTIINMWFNAERNTDLVNMDDIRRVNNITFQSEQEWVEASHILRSGQMSGKTIKEAIKLW